MRRLLWFTIGFTGACALGAYTRCGNWLLLLALFCLLACAGLKLLGKWREVKLILLGLSVAMLWFWGYDTLQLSAAWQYDGQTVQTSIEVTDYSWDSGYGIASDGTLTLEGKTYRVRFYLNEDTSLSPGDRVEGSFRLRYTPGGQEPATYHPGSGIFLLAYPEENIKVSHAKVISAKYLPTVLRKAIMETLDAVFPEDTLAFAKALLLGDTSMLTYEQDSDFKTGGIRHVVAVSGLHVSILFSLVYVLSGKRRVLTTLLGLPVLVLFAAMAGFTPSVNRACIMQGLMLLSLLLDKEYDPPTALSFAVLVMLIWNPMAVTSVSLQLSAGCMVGIFLFSEKIRQYLLDEKRLGPAKGTSLKAVLTRWFAGSVSVTLGAMAATMPLCAIYFGSVSLIGILTNLLTLWVISYIFYGIMAACALGAVWLPAGKAAAWLISWLIRFVEGVCHILARFPLAAVYTKSVYVVAWLVFFYVLLGVFLCSKKRQVGTFICCAVLSLLLALGASWLEPRLDSYRVTVLDVGQGQCILVQSQGENYLVDCGGDDAETVADLVAETLLSQGVGSLDGIILTHYDLDHAGAVPYLLTRIPADVLYLPDIADDNGIRAVLESTAPIRWVREEQTLTAGNAKLRIFPAEPGKSENESSLCILFQTENCDILVTGDRGVAGERALLAQIELPKLEVLVAGHHGSKSATSKELLEAGEPALAVICVGENSYGHPSDQVLQRLEDSGCAIWRTDEQGTLIIRG